MILLFNYEYLQMSIRTHQKANLTKLGSDYRYEMQHYICLTQTYESEGVSWHKGEIESQIKYGKLFSLLSETELNSDL